MAWTWLLKWAAFVPVALYLACLVGLDVALLVRGRVWGAALAALLVDGTCSVVLLPCLFYVLFARQREGAPANSFMDNVGGLAILAAAPGIAFEFMFGLFMLLNHTRADTLWLLRNIFGIAPVASFFCMMCVFLVAVPVVFVVWASWKLIKDAWAARDACMLFCSDACTAGCCPCCTTDHVELVEQC